MISVLYILTLPNMHQMFWFEMLIKTKSKAKNYIEPKNVIQNVLAHDMSEIKEPNVERFLQKRQISYKIDFST